MVVEILLDGRVVSTRNLAHAGGARTEPRLLKRLALQSALSANEVKPSEALRVTFRIEEKAEQIAMADPEHSRSTARLE